MHDSNPDVPVPGTDSDEVTDAGNDAGARNRYVINSALRTLELLKAFAQRPHRFTFAELMQLTGLEKNQLYRSIKTLEEAGFLALNPDGKFGMTELLHHLSSFIAPPSQRSLPLLAAPFLDELAVLTGESVNLFVRHGDYAVRVDRRDSPQMVRLASVLGMAAPLHAGAVPKAMLAFLPEEEREKILAGLSSLPAYTERTVLDDVVLRRELNEIRSRGYSISDGDYDSSARGVGAPIIDELGLVVAGISVGGPSFRVGMDTLNAFGVLAIQKAQEISLRLGQAN
jgi:IclR family acetate operon transcriptional repressor